MHCICSLRNFTRVQAFVGLLSLCSFLDSAAQAAELYFPSLNADAAWETFAPEAAGWNPALLERAIQIAGERHSSGLLVLYRGRILAERYWDLPDAPARYRNYVTGHDAVGRVIEDVASAQKSVVAVITGIAQEQGYLSVDDAVSQYLGSGWSRTTPENESQVTVRHLLSMTSGLADDLSQQATPGSAWRYNTPAYHLVMRVVSEATGRDRDALTHDWITARLGMHDSSWTARPWASADIGVGFSTTARDLARFGLMLQAGGRWENTRIIEDTDYLRAMLTPSQTLNPAYGLLWWLNGQEFALGADAGATRNNGPLIAGAPADLVAMQGADDRKLYLVPSLELVVTRLGYNGAANGTGFNEAFWDALMAAAPTAPLQ